MVICCLQFAAIIVRQGNPVALHMFYFCWADRVVVFPLKSVVVYPPLINCFSVNKTRFICHNSWSDLSSAHLLKQITTVEESYAIVMASTHCPGPYLMIISSSRILILISSAIHLIEKSTRRSCKCPRTGIVFVAIAFFPTFPYTSRQAKKFTISNRFFLKRMSYTSSMKRLLRSDLGINTNDAGNHRSVGQFLESLLTSWKLHPSFLKWFCSSGYYSTYWNDIKPSTYIKYCILQLLKFYTPICFSRSENFIHFWSYCILQQAR